MRSTFVQYFKSIYCLHQQHHNEDLESYMTQCIQLQFTKISDQAQLTLNQTPTEAQIRETLFAMGPDKAAGPDGISARFL